jgi:hypothetical protein
MVLEDTINIIYIIYTCSNSSNTCMVEKGTIADMNGTINGIYIYTSLNGMLELYGIVL